MLLSGNNLLNEISSLKLFINDNYKFDLDEIELFKDAWDREEINLCLVGVYNTSEKLVCYIVESNSWMLSEPRFFERGR